ncbi:MAG: hypothetical protein K0Q49_459 [Haloplasmataceae bacterium]|jgi:hypothetical protein|nr:hypothetical protein [Haloplasmataceae bacterium]
MAYTTFYDDVCFIEGDNPAAKKLASIKSDLSFKFGAQLKNLNDVKKDLALKAKKLGCNCVLNFKYGQKSRWLAIDDVAYYGEGISAILSQAEYDTLLNKTNK